MISAKDLHKKYSRQEALRGVTLSVPEGSAYALVGANGAGKTTTLRILLNILSADRGSATVLGLDSRRLSPRELSRIGYVSENQEFEKALTVSEYLAYLRPFYPDWDRELEASLLRRLHLPSDRKIGHLSHGMRMKMALAAALPYRPQVLILDEPFSGLDPLVRDDVMENLLLQAGEMTILISSHELSEIEGMVTHVGYLDEGRMLFEESMTDLSSRFREVHITLDHEGRKPDRPPAEWLDIRAVGNALRFVDSGFSEEALRAAMGSLNGGVRSIDAQPMGLRSIFTALAKSKRGEN